MKTIKVYKELASMISSRSSARALLNTELLSCNESIVLDFKGVIFISRAFADEMFKCISKNSNISMIKLSIEVRQMFSIVAKTQNGRNTNFHKVPVIKLNTQDSLEAFFNAAV